MTDYLTTRQVAIRLRVSPRRVRFLCARGELRGTQVGDWWIVTPQDLAAYLKGKRRRVISNPDQPKPDASLPPSRTCPTCGGDAETSPWGRDGACPDAWHHPLRPPTQPTTNGGRR